MAELAPAIVTVRASSVWELAALAWLALLAVPLAFIDAAVRRLPDPLTAAGCADTLALLAVAAFHRPPAWPPRRHGDRCRRPRMLLPALAVIRPGSMGLGDAKPAASVGAVLGWISWQALFTGTFAAFALAAVYGGALLVQHRASHLPLGPFILIGTLAAIAV